MGPEVQVPNSPDRHGEGGIAQCELEQRPRSDDRQVRSFFVQVAKGGNGRRCSLNLVQKEQASRLIESPATAHELELPQDELDVARGEHTVEPRMPVRD